MDLQRRRFLQFTALGAMGTAFARSRDASLAYWARVFAAMPAGLAAIAASPEHQVQLRCVRVRRDWTGNIALLAHDHGMAPRRWFAAASVVKLPMALLLAERIDAHGLDAAASIELHAPPATGEWGTDERLAETFTRSLNRTFAVSENVPFNRWYEFLGVDYIHSRLAALGYREARLISRLGSTDATANRQTGGGLLVAPDRRIHETRLSAIGRARGFPHGAALVGRGWQRGDGMVESGPHDFSSSNFLPLDTSLRMLQAVLYPETVPPAQRWRVSGALRLQLLRALTLRPRDSLDPPYDESAHPDGYARWFLVGDGAARYPQGVTVFGKSGMAYGFLSEVACVVDTTSGAEFLLGATIHANADGIYNDDRYEYDTVALPFMAALGRAVLEVEREAAHKR